MNNENLINNDDLTPSERRERASKAGKASGEARRARRTLREVVRMMLDEEIPTKDGGKVTKRAAMAEKMLREAVQKGNIKAAKLVADWSGEAPTKQELTGEDGAPLLVTFAEIDARFKAVNEHKDD